MKCGVLLLPVTSILSDGAIESSLSQGQRWGVFFSAPHVSPCLARSLVAILAKVVLCRHIHPVLISFLSGCDQGKFQIPVGGAWN